MVDETDERKYRNDIDELWSRVEALTNRVIWLEQAAKI